MFRGLLFVGHCAFSKSIMQYHSLFQVVALNGYSDTVRVESMQLSESCTNNKAESCEVDEAEADSRWQPELDVIYDVDESPPISLCLLLGFQVNHQQ